MERVTTTRLTLTLGATVVAGRGHCAINLRTAAMIPVRKRFAGLGTAAEPTTV